MRLLIFCAAYPPQVMIVDSELDVGVGNESHHRFDTGMY